MRVPPSPNWSRAMLPGPDLNVKITESYATHVARDTFMWAWPLVNIYNKRRGAEQSKELAYAGPVPAAPLNRIVMLTDYVAADERIVACPNQDVTYGGGSLGLEEHDDYCRLAHAVTGSVDGTDWRRRRQDPISTTVPDSRVSTT